MGPTLYGALNIAFMVGVVAVAFAGSADNPRPTYLCLLMAVCSSPLLWMQQINGRYALLSIFLAAYFMFYGASDLATLLGEAPLTTAQGLLSPAECAIVLGAILAVAGYRGALALSKRRATPAPARDWPMNLIVLAGLAFWAVGTYAVWVWQVKFQLVSSIVSKDVSGLELMLLLIARMLQPLGTIMLAYALIVTRSRPLLLLTLALIAVQIAVGFLGDSKETAMRGVIILIMGGVLLEGKVPKGWFVLAIAFVTLAFPIFQGFRAEVVGMRGISRADAAADIGRSLDLALSASSKVQSGESEDYRAPSFLQRAALKPTIELLILKTGSVAPFQRGYTLSLFFTGFVPRFIWPDKPDSSVGQLMNREFHVSEAATTYISATHLGELYWNFGWAGIIGGMLAFGFLLGYINSKCDLSERRTITRLLVLVSVIYAAIVRFEGSIALEYIVLVRSLAMIWVMHVLFARIPVLGNGASATPGAANAPANFAPQLLR